MFMIAHITACAGGESGYMNKEQTPEREIQRVFFDLEYMYSIEDIEVSMSNNYDGEFTWFHIYCGGVVFDDVNSHLRRQHGFELPKYIEIDSSNFIVMSFGRKLKMLFYYPESTRGEWPGDTSETVEPHPVFEREYHANTIFVYRVNPLPPYRFTDDIFTDNQMQFNYFKNIPFEVWPHISEFMRHEIEEPLHGFVDVQETDMRIMPHRNSEVVLRLSQGDSFAVLGYSDDGESIAGSNHWYYVRTSVESGNRRGYVHSSVVIIEEKEERS